MGHATYLAWLVGCAAPILGLQWLVFGRQLARERRAIALASVLVTAYLTVVDGWAIRDGVWAFDPEQLLGIRLAKVPLEEVLFFFLTSLLVTQSMTLFGQFDRLKVDRLFGARRRRGGEL